jgi:hypothetical protein
MTTVVYTTYKIRELELSESIVQEAEEYIAVLKTLCQPEQVNLPLV